jgi:hypothetical protein
MAININRLNGGNIVIGSGGSSDPTPPNGKVLYKTSSDGEWLESDADISDGAFNGFNEKNSAVAVIIPSKDANGNSVTSIGSSAFYDCSSLTSVTIPNSVTSIGSNAFERCTGLTSVTIPNSVTSIWNYAFADCDGLTCVTIPNSVTNIVDEAFYNCDGLTNVTIGNGVTSIGYSTFENCTGLTTVTIPDSVTSIGNGAFGSCDITSVTIVATGKPGASAKNVKQVMITAGVDSSITWNMPS